MVPVVCLVGPSNSGKTTLTVRLVEHLTTRGVRVATVKHASHGFQMDRPGTDSYRHFHAGAEAVLVASPGGYALVGRNGGVEPGLDPYLRLLPPVDLVLVEGFRGTGYPTIEVHRKGTGQPLMSGLRHRIALASDEPVAAPVPCFHLDDVEGLASFILQAVGRAPEQPARPDPA